MSINSKEKNFSLFEKIERQNFLYKVLNISEPCTITTPKILVNPKLLWLEQESMKLKEIGIWRKRGYDPVRKMLGRALYTIVKYTKPKIVVETGVAMGVSSTCILLAMEETGVGELISIDKQSRAGEIIPNKLKEKWSFHVGYSYDILPNLDLKGIDMFFHDSGHSYKCMSFEFEWAYPRLTEGGILVSDDISWNNSIFDLSDKTGDTIFFIRTSKNRAKAGVIVKGCKQEPKLLTLSNVFGG